MWMFSVVCSCDVLSRKCGLVIGNMFEDGGGVTTRYEVLRWWLTVLGNEL